ncbi:MAG: FISUMP domain-containing protein, partial [Bacteroidales bacterium]
WWRLMNNVGGSVANTGGRMKETGTKHWKSPNKGATDSFGFKALPGGVCGDTIFFSLLGQQGVWWTATDYDSVNARVWGLRFDQESANPGGWPKRNGASIRCVRD